MKIQISYLPGEAVRASWVKAFISKTFPKAKIKEREGETPRRIVYVTIKQKP